MHWTLDSALSLVVQLYVLPAVSASLCDIKLYYQSEGTVTCTTNVWIFFYIITSPC